MFSVMYEKIANAHIATADWAYSGVNFSIPGNGGPGCVQYLPWRQRAAESAVTLTFAACLVHWAWYRVRVPELLPPIECRDRCGKRILLVLMCVTFGMELGYKFSTKQLIYVLNPCHVLTLVQIYLLAAPPSMLVMIVFRLSMHMLNGPTLAMLFPVVNTRELPSEMETYWVQHGLLLVVPYYLMRVGGVYKTEPIKDYSWCVFSVGILFIYHFLPLQMIALVTQVNLNNVLCPAVSDPFEGRWYRMLAVCHQTLLLLVHGKAYTLLSQLCLPWPYTECCNWPQTILCTRCNQALKQVRTRGEEGSKVSDLSRDASRSLTNGLHEVTHLHQD